MLDLLINLYCHWKDVLYSEFRKEPEVKMYYGYFVDVHGQFKYYAHFGSNPDDVCTKLQNWQGNGIKILSCQSDKLW